MEPSGNKVDYLEPSVQPTPPVTTDTTATPSATTENIKYAGFWIRLVAYLLDGLVLAVPILAINFGLLFLSRGSFPYLNYLARGVDFLITYTYFVWMTFRYQATLGKMAVGLVVVSDKSSGLTPGQVLLREISKILSGLILYIGYMMAGFTKRKQALHDMIAGTTVIYKEPKKKFGAREITAISVASILPALLAFGIIIWLILTSLIAAKNKAKMMQSNLMTVQNNPVPSQNGPTSVQNNSANQNNSTNIFTSENGDFSISYPVNWTIEKANLLDSWVSFYPPDRSKDFFMGVSVFELPIPQGQNQVDFLNHIVDVNAKASERSNVEIINFTYNFDDGTSSAGKQVKGNTTIQGTVLKDWSIFIATSNKIYEIAYSSMNDNFDSNLNVFNMMVNSWKIKK